MEQRLVNPTTEQLLKLLGGGYEEEGRHVSGYSGPLTVRLVGSNGVQVSITDTREGPVAEVCEDLDQDPVILALRESLARLERGGKGVRLGRGRRR